MGERGVQFPRESKIQFLIRFSCIFRTLISGASQFEMGLSSWHIAVHSSIWLFIGIFLPCFLPRGPNKG